jgi:membrane-bound PQQ-dependent dehydrogenase (glucose/quinate/shikimate family)
MSTATSQTGGRLHADRPWGAPWFRWLTVLLLALAGLGMAVPGGWLITLGGSPYYLVAGLLILVAAALVLRRRRAGLHLYGLVYLASAIWSLWEVGLDAWALMPRLVFLTVAGLWLLLPAVRRDTEPLAPGPRQAFRAVFAILVLALVVGAGFSAVTDKPRTFANVWTGGPAAPASEPAAGEWLQYGGTARGARYSPLAQITPANVDTLEQAWVFRPGMKKPGGKREGGLQVTPLMVDGTLYGCTAFSSVFALDPVTGRQLWRHDPQFDEKNVGHSVCRGVAFFRAPPGAPDCPTRILAATVSNRLIALDAKTGQACRSFGTDGQADLLEGRRPDLPIRWSHPTSPPTLVNGTAVVGAYVVDNQSTDVPPGVIRGYDAVTGQLKWAFDPAQPDDTAPKPPGHIYTVSTPNSWTVASGDEALGLVYVAMGNGSPDFVGGHRSATTEKFSSAVIALDAATGAVRWSFQAVHHDLWDYDLAAQPVLTDFPTAQGPAPALILATKTGQVFVLDRRTGAPLTAVEERPVPKSDIPGEKASPTQPYSVGMPDFAGPDLTEADMWGLTPFDQLYCRIRFKEARYEGRYTPPHLGPSIRYPGELGGIDWGSVSVDEGRGLLIVNSNHMANRDELITRAQAQALGLVPRVNADTKSAPGGAMAGTPYAIQWGPFMSGLKVPCQRPPYGFLTAIDLKTRQVVWRRTLGNARNSGPFGIGMRLPFELGAPNIGGTVTTGGGLVFVAATQDEMFRAIDVTTGKTLWETLLPAGGHATPMTYRGRDGNQYVLIAAGGRSLRDKPGDHIVAYRLKANAN